MVDGGQEMKISIIIPCKNRLAHLQETLPYTLAQKYPDYEVLVVDYNCPQRTAEWLSGHVNPKVNCVMAPVGKDEWSLSGARNFGYKHSAGEMLFFLDADAKLTDPEFLHYHVLHCVDGSFICGWGYHEATGCMMIRRSAFEAVRGYNEAIRSWGMEDIDIYNRLQDGLAQEKRTWLGGIETIKHGDEWRNYYHGGKAPQATNEENFRISQIVFKGI